METVLEELKVTDMEANTDAMEVLRRIWKSMGWDGHYRSIEEPIWEATFGYGALPTAEETDPGEWWVPAEVGSRPKTDDAPRRSCTAQGTY
jgi:hypothetical protein